MAGVWTDEGTPGNYIFEVADGAADGSQVCRLTLEYGEPLHCRATRTLRIGRFGSSIRIHQQIERIAPSNIPVALWSVLQIVPPSRVILPGTAPLRPVAFAAPPLGADVGASGARVYHLSVGGEHPHRAPG